MNYLLAIIVAAAVLIGGLAWLNESQATKIKAEAQAQAQIIQANAQASATMTQANATMMLAAFPVVLAIGGAVGLSLAGAALLIVAIRWQPRRVIEQRVVFPQLEQGHPRRELWQAMSDTRQIEPIRILDSINKKV